MTLTRADVEAMLSHAESWADPLVAELCRSWLAVDDAPSGETMGFVDGAETDGLIGGVVWMKAPYIPAGTYKLVCIDTPQRERKWYDEGTPVEESAVSNAVGPGGIDTPTGGREG